MDDLTWLTNWYAAQCNEEWEHQFGVTIDTLDNPGWSLAVDLEETSLANKPFAPVYENLTEAEAEQGLDGDVRWMVAKLEGTKFKAYGGPRDLANMLATFRAWASQNSN